MTSPVFIPGPGVWIPASVAARIRHGLNRERQAAIRNHERIPDEVLATIELIDTVGAGWDDKQLSPDLSSLPSSPFELAKSISVQTAADILDRTPQAVTGLLARGSLHGEKTGRTWRVCAESVAARKSGTQCQH